MSGVTVSEVQGLSDLDDALGQFKVSTAKGVLRRVGIEALEPFDQRWRERAPRDTGQLAGSGDAGTHLTTRQAIQAEADRDSFVQIYSGPGANPQATQDEFGNHHQAAHPYMRPAWDETQNDVLDGVANGLGAEIDATAQRVARRAAALAARNGG